MILKWTFYKGSEGKTKHNKITHLWVFVCWRHGGILKIITQNKTNKTLHLFAPLNHLVPGVSLASLSRKAAAVVV